MYTKLRVAGIIKESIVDGPGIRLVVFAQGCPHNCEGCHNPHTHSFNGGNFIDIDDILNEIRNNPLLDGITLSGGEPFEQAKAFSELSKRAKKEGYNIISYTGYTYEYIVSHSDEKNKWLEFLEEIDILIDGRFELSKKNMLLKYRGSENQRIIDVKKTLKENSIQMSNI
ncbi:anaerobic ribonucleoside-triphosphate reductase activating protein NrdG [Clostridium putrefaciens]|uniref:Anaerobic ribonucleoside-triphosphate reductase-activating protein n=1 Tax=Clostridium putrefaciens TaxID=99675 RepID=A0A381J8F8_9CLOT|nr:anaerobic ribonucleoside-triphosphate reductase activating protein [Clostridium putrefaciens]SUY47540.1 anaerobic ribonucleoside-triphosphate reductase activating protein NrdG [Clostridium putrefaciens]